MFGRAGYVPGSCREAAWHECTKGQSMTAQQQQDTTPSGPSRKQFLRTAAGAAAGTAATTLGVRGAMADKMGRPLRSTTVRYYGLYWLDSEIKRNLDLVAKFNK